MLLSWRLPISGVMNHPITFSAKSKNTRDGMNKSSLIKIRLAGASSKCCAAGIDNEREETELTKELTPKHVAVVVDGSGRWAKSRGFSVEDGYRAAIEAGVHLALNCRSYGVKVLSLFGFSAENWDLPEEMINTLLQLAEAGKSSQILDVIKIADIRISYLGNRSHMPVYLQEALHKSEENSRENKGMHLVIAINYSGRYDITEAAKKICTKVKDGILQVEDIDEAVFEQHLETSIIDDEFRNPDLLIRTSGESRISNYMLWNLAYTELYFCNKMIPEFNREDLVEAMEAFQKRQRRFGGSV